MQIPDRNLDEFLGEQVRLCQSDLQERIQRAAFFRNFYLQGDGNGDSAVFNKTYDSIEDECAYLCSSVDLRYALAYPGGGDPVMRAKCKAAAHELLEQSRASDLDTSFEEATRWSLVEGKTLIKMNWSVDGLEPLLVSSAMIGVLRPDLDTLDKQECFVHSSYILPAQLRLLIGQMYAGNPDAGVKLYRKIMQQGAKQQSADAPDQAALLKQVIIGGFQPYQGVGGVGSQQSQQTRGEAQWLSGPYPSFDPKVIADLIRLDEVWIKDDARTDDEGRREWSTFQSVGNIVLFGRERRMNLFADMLDPANPSLRAAVNDHNPLAFKTGFVEFCPNKLKNFFYGRSEIANIALLQTSLNKRVDGINRLLRLQEDPPMWFQGGTGMNDQKKAKLTKPGGYMHEPGMDAKPPQALAPTLPPGLYESLKENERMFDVMTGMTPMLQGMAQGSVRSNSQAGQMTRNATPRFKNKAIRVERSIQTAAAILLDLLKAKSTTLLTGWVTPAGGAPIETKDELIDPSVQPPAPGLLPVQFYLHQLPSNIRVTVDSHSSSPAFDGEAENKAVLLKKAGAMTNSRFIDQINPPDADDVLAESETAEVLAAQAAKQQAMQAAQQSGKPNGKGK